MTPSETGVVPIALREVQVVERLGIMADSDGKGKKIPLLEGQEPIRRDSILRFIRFAESGGFTEKTIRDVGDTLHYRSTTASRTIPPSWEDGISYTIETITTDSVPKGTDPPRKDKQISHGFVTITSSDGLAVTVNFGPNGGPIHATIKDVNCKYLREHNLNPTFYDPPDIVTKKIDSIRRLTAIVLDGAMKAVRKQKEIDSAASPTV